MSTQWAVWVLGVVFYLMPLIICWWIAEPFKGRHLDITMAYIFIGVFPVLNILLVISSIRQFRRNGE